MPFSSDTLRIQAGSSSWPHELDDIEGAPEALWARGRLELLAHRPRLAIVGTRAPTPYGVAQAARFAAAIAEAGVTIVSGMARGIDQVAHRGAMRTAASTIAVLGSGVDRPWPEGEIVSELLQHGLLLSEFLPGESPRPHHFPLRNRVISGLCAGVLVIEAAHASGSLITAQWAADQGKTVYALPGRVDHPMSRGVHRLLREGATLVESPEEVLEDLLGEARAPCAAGAQATSPLSATEAAILEALRGETSSADELAARLNRDVCAVLVDAVSLELRGRIARAPGGLYYLHPHGGERAS